MIGSLQSAIKVLGERHIQVLQLRSQTLIEIILALLRIVDGRLISVVPKMASSNEAITTCVCKLRLKGYGRHIFYRYCQVHMPPRPSFLCLADEHGRLSAGIRTVSLRD